MRTGWQIGDHIEGRWEIIRILQGGAGIVYIVYDQACHEPLAAKTFREEVFAASPLIADRFMQEALAWVRLDVHPNVTQARMVQRIEGRPFLFLEYVSGGDLGSWIGTPRLTEDLPQVLRFAVQFCDGMIHALSKGIRAHRDVKPRNCLITHDGVLKVTDFGLAKLFDGEQPGAAPHSRGGTLNLDLTKTAVGTCTHMAPEQFANVGQVDARVDIYSFGVMLYQMIRGELPFSGESWQDLEHLHKTQPAPYLENTDPRMADLVQTCLSKDPAGRFSGFAKLRECLARLYEEITGSPPPQPVHGASLNAVQWNNKGSSLDNLKRRAEAIACYDVALKLDPKLVSAWSNKGVVLLASQQPEKALVCFDEALKLNPKLEKAWSNRGVVFKSLGKAQEAMDCYDRALKLNPRYPNAWINKGVLLRAQGKTAQALDCYNRALRLDPSEPNAWTNKGNVLCALERQEEALGCYDHALSIDPGLDRTWLNKGLALATLGRLEESLNCYTAALRVNPLLEQAWFLTGMTLVNAFQRHREALPYFEQAERLGSKEAPQGLAVCRKALGAA